MAEEMYQWSSATYNVGSADNIPGKMTEWSRGTVADGKWLNRVTIIPFSGRDEYLLESINDIHDKKQPKLTNDNAGYGISIDAESEEIENAIIKLNPINTSNIGYVSGDNNEIGFALSADITANSITAQELTLVNLVVDNVTAYNTSAHNISGVSAIEGSTAIGLEPTIYGFKSINGTTLSSTNISGPTQTKNTDNIINATNVVESNSANWSNLSAIKYYTTDNELTSYTTTNGTVTFSSNNIGISVDDNNNLLLEVDENFGNSYYNYAVNGNCSSTVSVESPSWGDVVLGNGTASSGGFVWGTYDKPALATGRSIAMKDATATNASIAIKGATADSQALAIINSTANANGIALIRSTADNAALAALDSLADNYSVALMGSTADHGSYAMLNSNADYGSEAFEQSQANSDSMAVAFSYANDHSFAIDRSNATTTAFAAIVATASNESVAFVRSSADNKSIAIKGAANNQAIAFCGTAYDSSISIFNGNAVTSHSIGIEGGAASDYSIALYGGTASNHSLVYEGGEASDHSIATRGGIASNYSLAINGSTASDHAIALGKRTYASASAMSVGTYNLLTSEIEDMNPLFTVGNGKSDDSRSNAFVVYDDGSISASQYMGIESVANSYYNISKKLSYYKSDTLDELNNGAVALGVVSPCSANLSGCFAWGTDVQIAKVSAFSIGFNGTAYNKSLSVKGSYADDNSVALIYGNATNSSLASLCAGAQEHSMAMLNATANNTSYAFLSGTADTHSIAGLNAYANNTSIAINYAGANNQSIALEMASADNNSLAINTASANQNSLALLNSVADRNSIAIKTASADNSSIAEWNSSANNNGIAIYNTTANAASLGIMYSTADNTSIAIQNSNANRNSIAIRSSTADYTSVAIQNASANNNALAMCSSTANDYSVAIGPGTYADTSAYVIGKYNAKTATTTNKTLLFAVGNGTSDTDRKNAFEVYTDGSIYAPNLNIDTTKWEYGTDDEYRPISFANSIYKSSYDARQTFYGSMVYDKDVDNGLRYNPVKHQLSVSAISASKLNLGDNCDIVFGNNTKSSLKQQIGITTGRSSKEIIWTFNNNSHDSSAYLGFTYFNQPSIDTVTATNRINDGIGGWFYFGGQDIDTNGSPTVDCYSTSAEGYGVIAKAYSASEYYLGNSKISDLINAAGSKAYVNGTTLML